MINFINFNISCPANQFEYLRDNLHVSVNNRKLVENLLSGHSRCYHNRWHIAQMFHIHQVLRFEHQLTFPSSVIHHAIYYHDAIYDAKSKTNEADSAKLWLEHTENVLELRLINPVEKLIMATAAHFADVKYDDITLWFIGLDLASLAAPWDMFVLNNKLIRLEFSHVSDEDWEKGRYTFLEKALAQDKIYRHPIMHKYFEQAARENIQKLIELKL